MQPHFETHTVSVTADFEPPKTYAKGRTCAADGCTVRLSEYNPAVRCSAHQTTRDARFPCSPGQGKARRQVAS